MSRSRRGGRGAAQAEPPAVRASGPTASAAPLLIGVVALVAVRMAGAFVPGRWLWGMDLGRDVDTIAFVTGTLVTLAACVPFVFGAVARVWPASRAATWLLAAGSALALALFMHAHPDLTLWTGDTALRHGEFTTVERPETIAKQALRGDLFLHHTLPRALAAATGSTAEDVGRAQGALLAFLTALAGWRLAATLGASGLAALAVAAVAACTAALALDNGYAKATVELGCLTTFMAAPLVRLARDGSGLGLLGTLVAVSLLLHRSALALVPAWIVGAVFALRSGRARERGTWIGVALPLAALAFVLPHVLGVFASFDMPEHVTARGTAAPFARALAPGHLLDVANVLVLLSPTALLLPLLLALGPRPSRRARLAMAAYALPPALLVLLLPPQQGLPRDWDVFAFAGATLAAVAAWRLAPLLAARTPGLGLPLALVAAIPALQWAALPWDPDRAMARAESILVGPPARDREEAAQGLGRLGMARYIRGDVQNGRRLFQLSLDRSPHPRMLVEWGLIAYLSGRPQEAILYFRRSTMIDPDLASAWQGVGESAAALGDTVSLHEAIGQLERLEPAGTALAGAREQLTALRAVGVRRP